jgi:hypothetical protein
MFDGRAVDGCFVCELLYPDAYQHDCPRCGRRMRYQPAIMMSEAALRDSVHERVLAFAHAGPRLRQARLIELLEHLHRFAPASLYSLDELGDACAPDLDELRRDYQALVEGAV